MKVTQAVHQASQQSLDALNFCVSKSEPFEKVVKVNCRLFNLVSIAIGGLSKASQAVLSQFEATYGFFESIRIFGLVNSFVTPKDGKYFFTDAKNSWQKKTDRVFLAIHSSLKLINGFHRYSLINLGRIAKVSIGYLPIWKLVYDGFMVLSSFFGCWDAINNIIAKKKKIAEAESKIEKWENRATSIALIRSGNQAEISQFEKKYSDKVAKLNSDAKAYAESLKKLDSAHPDFAHLTEAKRLQMRQEVSAKVEATAAKIKSKAAVWQGRLSKIAGKDYQGLAQELSSKNVDAKIRKWEVIKANAKVDRNKNILYLISSSAKIAVISMALIFSVGQAFFTPAYLLPILLCGTVNDSGSLTRHLYTRYTDQNKVTEANLPPLRRGFSAPSVKDSASFQT